MAINPIPLSKLNHDYFKVKIMLLGAQFTGKSVFSLGSQMFRTLHLDVDSFGSLSAKCFMGNVEMNIPPVRQDLVESVAINSIGDMQDALSFIESNWKRYDLIVVDTITDFQKMVVNQLLGKVLVNRLTEYDYGPILNTMQQVTDQLKRIPVHVIFNAHESSVKRTTVINGKDQAVFTPAFDGQYIDVYHTHFSEIWRYILLNNYVKDEQGITRIQQSRWIQCQPDETFLSKDRSVILEKYEYPFIDYIFNKIFQHIQNNGVVNET